MAAKKQKQKQKIIPSKWNTRKLAAFLMLYAGSFVLCFTGKATGAETYWLWAWLFGIYVTGNIGAKVITPEVIGKFKTALSKFKRNKRKESK